MTRARWRSSRGDVMQINGREIIFWSTDRHPEALTATTRDDAIWAGIDDTLVGPGPGVVYGYALMIVKPSAKDADAVIEGILDRWDEEYGNPDECGIEVTKRMREAATAFLAVLCEEYKPWVCECIYQETVDIAAWLAEHKSDQTP